MFRDASVRLVVATEFLFLTLFDDNGKPVSQRRRHLTGSRNRKAILPVPAVETVVDSESALCH